MISQALVQLGAVIAVEEGDRPPLGQLTPKVVKHISNPMQFNCSFIETGKARYS